MKTFRLKSDHSKKLKVVDEDEKQYMMVPSIVEECIYPSNSLYFVDKKKMDEDERYEVIE